MKLSDYAIQQLVPYIVGDDYPPYRKGTELVVLFNEFGERDIYRFDNGGLPKNPKSGRPFSRKDYVENRLQHINTSENLRQLLEKVINEAEDKILFCNSINELIKPDGYNIVNCEDVFSIQGGVIDRRKPIHNESNFNDIQNRIIVELEKACVSIWVAMAWFTNDVLFNKLLEKDKAGIDVKLLIYQDGVNSKHGVDFSKLNYRSIRGGHGGIMHNKFCVIDNQTVITGSYNRTNNAEFKNEENITIEKDPEQASKYSVQFRQLFNQKKD